MAMKLFAAFAAALCAAGAAAADRYVAQNGQTPDPGAGYVTWGQAASNIQDAVNKAAVNDTIWVGAGHYYAPAAPSNTYGPTVVVLNKALALRSSNSAPESTIIDGGGQYRGITIQNFTTTTNLYIVDGFTITNCSATNYGGGILVTPVSATYMTTVVQNCTITDNKTYDNGGGIYSSRHLTVSNCVIRNNMATNNPAGVAPGSGGGMFINYHALVTDSIFHGNRSMGASNDLNRGGSAVHMYRSRQTFRNTLIYDNWGNYPYCGYAIFSVVGSGADPAECMLNLENCVIFGHTVGGGIHARRSNWTLNILNSIIYSNTPVNFTGNACSMGPGTAITNLYMYYSCTITNGLLGTFPGSNTTNYPAFVDYAAGDFRLSDGSPCINAGTNQAWMAGAPDLDRRSRVDRFSGIVDMGCYEYHLPGMIFSVR